MENEKKSIWKKNLGEIWSDFKEYAKTPQGKKTIVIFSIFLIFFIVLGIIVYERYFAKEKQNPETSTVLPGVKEEKKEEIKKIASYLDGQMYLENVANRHPLGIMIENHPDARPQIGLDKAKIIYEAVTEGGITRFMALYGPDNAPKVGPVRSARTYYLDWCLEYDCFYAHVGGNLDALDLIPQIKIKDLDQFRYGSEAYWREPEKGKATEHTMYTDTEKLWAISQTNEWDMKSQFESFEFKKEPPMDQRPETQSIGVNFSTSTYNVTWKYAKDKNIYERYMAGVPHKDRETGEILTAKNIIIQEVNRWYAPTEINEEGWAMKTTGEGKAKIVLDGKLTEGTWKKADRKARTEFYDSEGNKIKFNSGVFWYEIVPPGTLIQES